MEERFNGKRYNTLINMNKPITYYGLTGVQVGGVALILFFGYVINPLVTGVMFFALLPLINKNKQALSKGDINYLSTLRCKNFTRPYYSGS